MNKQFLLDVDKGLHSKPKFLSSRYFYDEIGDKLFVDIMKMPEYYLTNSEFEIFCDQTEKLINSLALKRDTHFELVELGAGDGTKTKELLKCLLEQNFSFDYCPVDISQHALDDLHSRFSLELPNLSIKPLQGDYFEVLSSIGDSKHPKIVLFLGSNMGNLHDHEASYFLNQLEGSLNTKDKLVLGLDLIKPEEIVLPAYDDSQKITSKFNLNLLERMNRELHAEFDISQFKHQPEYTEKEGIAKSFLVSNKVQSVNIKALNKTITFFEGEKIHTEISRKYNDEILAEIISTSRFTISNKLTDSKRYFADYILTKL